MKEIAINSKKSSNLAQIILNDIMQFRRSPSNSSQCAGATCPTCSSHHISKIQSFIHSSKPIELVLPAFPGKSPNPQKVLGALPDYAEELSLKFLNNLCEKIKDYYKPGMKIIICSDGRVFSDIVGIKESDISAYQVKLDSMITRLSLDNISTFNLDDVYRESDFNFMRLDLMNKYSEDLDQLKLKIKKGAKEDSKTHEKDANRMFRGITRFLFEDSMTPGLTQSRASLQKDSKARAYEVIRRSNAWSKLIESLLPSAIRLSIHPQICGSKKLGIRLIANESWMTPWHGVAVKTSQGFKLLKRSEAESLNAKLIYSKNGSPSFYDLTALEPV